jgi:acetyl esterase/lipase
MKLRDEGEQVPGALALLCPWTDLSGDETPDPVRVERDVILHDDLLEEWAAAYAGASSRREPLISPRFGELVALPPMLIHSAGRDLIGADGERLAVDARHAGVTTVLVVEPDLIHDWHMFAGAFPEASSSLSDVARWLNSILSD